MRTRFTSLFCDQKMALRVFCCLCSLCISVTCQNLTGDNICRYRSIMVCCKDYKQVENSCVECDPGFRGTNCSLPCPTNYYGRRCSRRCYCSSFQYCDGRRGCLCNMTSDNCTDFNEPKATTEEHQTTLLKFATTASSYKKAMGASSYVTKFGIPSLLSVIVLLVIGLICLRIYQKKKQKIYMKDNPESQMRNTPNCTQQQQTEEQQPCGTSTDTSEMYSHLNLRVNLNDTISGNTNSINEKEESLLLLRGCQVPVTKQSKGGIPEKIKILEREKTPINLELSPYRIPKRNDMRVSNTTQNSWRDIDTESEDPENDYFDMCYTGHGGTKWQKKPLLIKGQSPSLVSEHSKWQIPERIAEKGKPTMLSKRSVHTISKQNQMPKPDETQDRHTENEDLEDVYFDVCYPGYEKNMSPEHTVPTKSNSYVKDVDESEYANGENELYMNS